MIFFYHYLRRNRLLFGGFLSFVVIFNLALLMGIYLFNTSPLFREASPSWMGRKGLSILSMAEFSFIFFMLPLMISIFSPLSDKKVYRICTTWKYVLLCTSIPLLLIIPAVIPAVYLYMGVIPFTSILKLGLTLFFTGILLTAIYFFTCSLCSDSCVSIVVTYLVFLSLISGIVLMNPVIEWVADPSLIIQATLLLNPFISIASSINMDILRMDPLYSLSTIGVLQFHYPEPLHFWLVYGVIYFGLLTLQIKFLKRFWFT